MVLILLLLCITLQIQFWGGNGSLTEVRHLRNVVTGQKLRNADMQALNNALAAEVRSLKSGTEAVEELARSELAMTGPDETFYHITELPEAAGPELPKDDPSHTPP